MDLSEARHAFITGGASGIGLGLGDALVALGICVTIADINGELAARVAEPRGDRFQALKLDVRDLSNWQSVKAAAETKFGGVDILVNNAGIAPDGLELADMSAESFQRVIDINLTGVFNGLCTFAGAMRGARRGHIVNTASISGLATDGPGSGGYGPAKAGVILLSETLRLEMAPHGIGVSVLCPSFVATDLMSNTARVVGDDNEPIFSLRGAQMTPAEVAERVLAAIEQNEPYIFTNADRLDAVASRFSEITRAHQRQAGSPRV